MRNIYAISFLVLSFLIVSVCSMAQEEKTVEKSYDGLEKIEANFASGDLTLIKGTSNTVKIKLVYTYDDDQFTPEFEQNGSKLEIDEKFERGSTSGYSKWTMTIPDGLSFDVNSGSGDITAADLEVDIDSNSGSGDIDLENVNGDLDVNNGSGDVNVDQHSGEVSVNTGSGDVTLSDSKGEVDINAGSGDIKLTSVNADFSINTGSGDVRADDVTISGKSSFNSGSGDTEISLGAVLDHSISINSGSGDAELDFNGHEISGFVTMKANKKNGEIDAPFEFDKVEEEDQGNQTIIKKTVKLGSKDININVGTGSGKAVIRK